MRSRYKEQNMQWKLVNPLYALPFVAKLLTARRVDGMACLPDPPDSQEWEHCMKRWEIHFNVLLVV